MVSGGLQKMPHQVLKVHKCRSHCIDEVPILKAQLSVDIHYNFI